MTFNAPITRIPDEATLRAHVAAADLPTLILTTAHLTSDPAFLKEAWKPKVELTVVTSGMESEQEAAVRETCLEALISLGRSAAALPQRPTFDQLQGAAYWLMGPAIEPFLPLIAEELSSDIEDLRRPVWHKDQVAPQRDFSVAIIGAGESGLALALRLKQAGVPFTIYEKGDDVGGTWRENHYPGIRVDINSFLYSFAFARQTWKDYFGKGEDVFRYMRDVAREFGLYEHIRFGSEVTAARWDETASLWRLDIATGDSVEHVSANIAVSAVGQLNRPLIPDFPGRESFTGPAFHSARWQHDVDLTGKRVAVIGTGASAAQFIPQVAAKAAQLTILARTTNWLLPTPELHDPVPESVRWLMDNLPGYALWYRATQAIPQSVGILEEVIVDPNFPPTERAVSALNAKVRDQIHAWMRPQFAARPDLEAAIIPDSPLGGKRIIRDNGTWLRTLQRDNVILVRDAIEEITPTGIRLADGSHREFDVIIYGTGFQASKFLMPMTVVGRDGRDLQEYWDGDARAYVGTAIPGFPNLFCMYGPNTNLVVNASIIMFSELTAKYIVDAARLLLQGGHAAMEVRDDVFRDYNLRVDEATRLRAWGFSKVSSWYKNSKGRVAQNFPFSAAEFWLRTHEVRAPDYHLAPFTDAKIAAE